MSLSREELEDMAATVRDMARVSKATYDAFLEAGFDEHYAIRLTSDWMIAIIQTPNP